MKPDLYIDKLAYARSLFDGAERIFSTAKDCPIETIGIPFFLLIGFGIENVLKGYFDFKSLPAGKWQRSHDLSALLHLATDHGLQVSQPIRGFIDSQSIFHSDFWFRYPEKAGTANVNYAPTSLLFCDALLRIVFDATGARAKL